MSLLSDYEDALRALLAETDDDGDPIVAYVTYAVTTDAETGEQEYSNVIVPAGQREYVTRGLLAEATDAVTTGTMPTITFASADYDEDDDE
ncbi:MULTISPECIES: hypothetical protein [unclassified Cryobacterium]|uniref:hypothetical protein n=1 Tax=unclassified Cryobacterium TaxID=2649013 RepID=UPI00106CA385|nr:MULTISPECIES: hypothetical protein [unclassified Cryobacterium]TFC59426.1 hypothetical protein E3O68_00560 [Cryobacterium sp. TMB3-1-2]TFC67222.1 hypothetical protein E3T21_17255 [Cryobacterium sp. TMB3-15]TFC73265.1 hypothetical protein E3T22_16800 [Cryobacterium sp. TMB3-10]TFD46153.1 hypothetical protein E3T58_01435 [Cryobacterium sp. TMB3-12]